MGLHGVWRHFTYHNIHSKSVHQINTGIYDATDAACVALNIEACKMTRTDFEECLLWEGVVVLKELILNSFYFGTV